LKTSKTYTLSEAKIRLENYCIYQDRCHKEIEQKLYEMKMISEAKEIIIVHLIQHNFLNETRFSQAFARGKFNQKKWGKQRIIRELKVRNITDYNITTALQEIDEEEYYKTFNELAQKRFSTIIESNSYKKRKKLADYLLYRGWETALVYSKTIELIP
jgi:regulatory protein